MAMAGGGEETLPASLRVGSEFEFFCELCIEDDIFLEAEGFCVDCGEYLCNECSTHHRRSRPARYHEVLGKREMPVDKGLSSDQVSKDIKTKCKIHKGKHVRFYCNDHEVLGCKTCVHMEHINCKNVVNILEVSNDLLDGQEYRQLVQQLEAVEKTARDIIQMAQYNTSAAERYKSKAREAVQELKDKMNSRFEIFEIEIDNKVATLEKEDVEKMKSVSASCDAVLKKTNTFLSDIQKLNASRKVCQLYISLKETSTCPRRLQKELKKIGRKSCVRVYEFEHHTHMDDVLNLSHYIGKVSVLDSLQTKSVVSRTQIRNSDNLEVIDSPDLPHASHPYEEQQRGPKINTLQYISAENIPGANTQAVPISTPITKTCAQITAKEENIIRIAKPDDRYTSASFNKRKANQRSNARDSAQAVCDRLNYKPRRNRSSKYNTRMCRLELDDVIDDCDTE